ncbi:lycopene cyclase domain-containing protein [Humidisolicoccus flavus]|uniref:lycopene cyclase domain-containing protein n=1 Tax=Humidisolicoccus flavus TaxID=3111414 RepID=UPI003245A063
MTYLLANTALVLVAIIVSALAWRYSPRGHAIALTVAFAVLVIMTAIFDTIMIAVDFFAYSDEHILGILIGLAPIEDFAYPLAALLVVAAIWNFGEHRRARQDGEHASGRRA